MNLRKLFNLSDSKQTLILVDEVKTIMERCDVIASQEFKEQKENQHTHDNKCPKCRAKQDRIVDKIRSVEGSGKVKNDFYFGFGSIKGSMNIDTKAVNHCNECGHQWKKFKTKYVSKTDIVRVILNYLSDLIKDPELNKKLSWKTEAIQVFNGIHAEAIVMLVNKEKRYIRNKAHLNKSTLKKYYYSVFDGDYKKKLEKL